MISRLVSVLLLWFLLPQYLAAQEDHRSALGPYPFFFEFYGGYSDHVFDDNIRHHATNIIPKLTGIGVDVGYAIVAVPIIFKIGQRWYDRDKTLVGQQGDLYVQLRSTVFTVGTRFTPFYPLSGNIFLEYANSRYQYSFAGDANGDQPVDLRRNTISIVGRVMLLDPIGTGGGIGFFAEPTISFDVTYPSKDNYQPFGFRIGTTIPLALSTQN